jgi:hypothetical protein
MTMKLLRKTGLWNGMLPENNQNLMVLAVLSRDYSLLDRQILYQNPGQMVKI